MFFPAVTETWECGIFTSLAPQLFNNVPCKTWWFNWSCRCNEGMEGARIGFLLLVELTTERRRSKILVPSGFEPRPSGPCKTWNFNAGCGCIEGKNCVFNFLLLVENCRVKRNGETLDFFGWGCWSLSQELFLQNSMTVDYVKSIAQWWKSSLPKSWFEILFVLEKSYLSIWRQTISHVIPMSFLAHPHWSTCVE